MAITRERFTENSSAYIRGQIVDQTQNPVDVGSLTAATITLYDIDTGQIINNRENQSILSGSSPEVGDNNVVFGVDAMPTTETDPTGWFQWNLQPPDLTASPQIQGDNPIITPRRQMERHRVMFHFEWTANFSTGAFNYEVEIEVVNLRKSTNA